MSVVNAQAHCCAQCKGMFLTKALISSHHVRSQVNTQDCDRSQRQGDINDDEKQERSDLWNVTCQSIGNGFFQIIKDQTAWRIRKRLVSHYRPGSCLHYHR